MFNNNGTDSRCPVQVYDIALYHAVRKLIGNNFDNLKQSNRLVPSRHSAPTKHHLSCASSDPNEHHQRPKSANIFTGPAFGKIFILASYINTDIKSSIKPDVDALTFCMLFC